MNVSLVMVTGDGKSRELPAMHLPISIGRGDDCKLRVPVAAVSRRHCELAEEDDELVVRDLKSSNGTFVNKERVKTRELIPGDLISVGPVVLVVRIDGHPKAIDPIISWANGAVGPGDAEGGRPGSDGVPTWSGQKPAPAAGASKPAAKPGAPKPAKKDEDLSSMIADLSESDFDIDFGEDDGTPKKK
ncbi:MAG TPA: FHA domain-containing protein [Phycisphaerales bacterium]|nr:FHA domain-containing protein [Phycisphaerales bacterium]